jgi:hypothetical protein
MTEEKQSSCPTVSNKKITESMLGIPQLIILQTCVHYITNLQYQQLICTISC